MAILNARIPSPVPRQHAVYFRFSSPREWFDHILKNHKNRLTPDERMNIERGYSEQASQAFTSARATIQRPAIRGAKQAPAVCGGAWVIPSVLANHPMPARLRAACKLPPLRVKVRLNTASCFSTEQINIAAAKLARGLWEYKLSGGIVELSLWYFSQGHNSLKYGTKYIRMDISVPITNEAQLAYALSGFSYREVYITQGLAVMGDLQTPPTQMDPDVLWLTPPEVDKRLAAFGLLHEGEK